jgi:hypothetical protein
MRKLFATLLIVATFPAGSLLGAETEIEVVPSPAADAKVYGEYPMAYKEIITRWMNGRLVDPASAVFEWVGQPRPGKHSPSKGPKVVGYIVDFKVNARNQFGGATGKQKYQVVIRNGEIVWGGRPRS